jgi:hypothetical protein
VPAGSYIEWQGALVLTAAEILQAYASAASAVNLTAVGVETA